MRHLLPLSGCICLLDLVGRLVRASDVHCPVVVVGVGVRVLRKMRIRGNEGENASRRESVCVCVGVIVLWIVRMRGDVDD